LNELTFTIWEIIFSMELTPRKFDAFDAREQAGIYNSVRFLTKEKISAISLNSETRIKAHRGIDRAVGKILFD